MTERQLDLGLLGGLEEALQRLRVLAQVDAVVLLELVGEVVDDPAVEVVAAQMGVARGRPDLDDPVADVEDADVEGAAAEVEDEDGLVAPSCPCPYARAAAVGSLMIRRTSSPAILPASLVAWRCASLKYAGTVITASVTRSPRNLPASSTSLRRTCAEISSGAYCLPFTSKRAAPSGPATTSKETALSSLGDLVVAAADEPLRRVDGALRVEDRLSPGDLAHEPLPGVE